MLVHAICGAGISDDLIGEYKARRLAVETMHGARWDRKALAELPEGVLRAIYERITA